MQMCRGLVFWSNPGGSAGRAARKFWRSNCWRRGQRYTQYAFQRASGIGQHSCPSDRRISLYFQAGIRKSARSTKRRVSRLSLRHGRPAGPGLTMCYAECPLSGNSRRHAPDFRNALLFLVRMCACKGLLQTLCQFLDSLGDRFLLNFFASFGKFLQQLIVVIRASALTPAHIDILHRLSVRPSVIISENSVA